MKPPDAGADASTALRPTAGPAEAQTGPMAQRLPFPLLIPFVDTLGLELWHFADGRAELRVDVGEPLHNSWGVAHGGVLMTLLDVAMAHAARSTEKPPDEAGVAGAPAVATVAAVAVVTAVRGMATVEMKTSFMRPAQGRLRAVGELMHRTATLAFTEGRVFDEQGQLCAHATGTFKFLAGLPVSRRESKLLQQRPAVAAAGTPPGPV